MSIPHRDEWLLQRFLDGQMDPTARTAFAARLAAEPALQQAADVANSMRDGFRAARSKSLPGPSASFTANLLAATRQLPTRQQLEQAEVAAGGVGLCRKLLLAAAILAGLGCLWHSGLVCDTASSTLQAAPDDVQREIERLDALLEAGKVPTPVAPRIKK